MINQNKVAIISSGNGGQGFAAYFTYKGYETTLYAREQERVTMFHQNEFIMSGVVNEKVNISLISCDMEEVIKDAHLIMVTTPAQYHHVVARDMAPYLQEDQIVVLNPGRSFGTTQFIRILKDNGLKNNVIVAETETLLFTCRSLDIGRIAIYQIKDNVLLAAHNPADTPLVIETLKKVFPTIMPADSILETAFCNMGIIFHPLPALMNITRIERGERILHYKSSISPLVSRMLEKLDDERVAIAHAAGIETAPAISWLKEKYGSTGDSLYECLQNTEAYNDVYTPTDIYTRYVFEDIPTGCVPMLATARYLGVEAKMFESIINWATQIYGFDFYEKGRNEKVIDFQHIYSSTGTNHA